MPWCPSCDRFLAPATVRPDGTCARCGQPVDPGRAHAPTSASAATAVPDQQGAGGTTEHADEPLDPLPWHFKLLVAAITVYLGYRVFQGIEWLVQQV